MKRITMWMFFVLLGTSVGLGAARGGGFGGGHDKDDDDSSEALPPPKPLQQGVMPQERPMQLPQERPMRVPQERAQPMPREHTLRSQPEKAVKPLREKPMQAPAEPAVKKAPRRSKPLSTESKPENAVKKGSLSAPEKSAAPDKPAAKGPGGPKANEKLDRAGGPAPAGTVPGGKARIRELGVKNIPPAPDRRQVLNTGPSQSQINVPNKGPDGRALQQKSLDPKRMNDPIVKTQLASFSSGAGKAKIQQFNSTETVKGSYYWHSDGGTQYCHYYDPWGYHWYGWYYGDTYFWTRYYADYWWWYDPYYDRWVYWYDDYWWWPGPYVGASVYLYIGGSYVIAD